MVHIAIIGLFVCHLATLAFTYAWYRYADHHDGSNALEIIGIIVEALFWALLFVFLTFAVGGWGAIRGNFTRAKTVKTVVGAVGMMTTLTLLRYVLLGWWAILVAVGTGFFAYMLVVEIFNNSRYTWSRIKAHIMIIRNSGINPRTTPVYQKYVLYHVLTGYVGVSATLLAVLVIVMVLIDADHWVELMIFYLFTAVLLAVLVLIYRPRGAAERYFVRDNEEEGDRQAVQLDDISSFQMPEEAGTNWDASTRLPLQPEIITPGGVSPAVMSRVDPAYTEKLNPGHHYS